MSKIRVVSKSSYIYKGERMKCDSINDINEYSDYKKASDKEYNEKILGYDNTGRSGGTTSTSSGEYDTQYANAYTDFVNWERDEEAQSGMEFYSLSEIDGMDCDDIDPSVDYVFSDKDAKKYEDWQEWIYVHRHDDED